MTHKFSQSHFRIQTRSQRRREGPRRLTKALLPSSRCPMGAYQTHRAPDGAQAEGWCVYARDARQGPDRACFSSWSGSNPRSTSYAHMPKRPEAQPGTGWGVPQNLQSPHVPFPRKCAHVEQVFTRKDRTVYALPPQMRPC
jgi:hypothetical protein